MNNKIKKENKNVPLTDLLTTTGLDEMQLSKMYEIAYNCFKAFFWANVVIVVALMFVGMLKQSLSFLIVSSVIMLVTAIIYVAFAVMLAKTGSMPPKFAKYAGSKSRIAISIMILISGSINAMGRDFAETGDILYLVALIPAFTFVIAMTIPAFLTRKNNKVVEKFESEEE